MIVDTVNKIRRILSPGLKRKMIFISFVMCVSAVAELAAVAGIMPVAAAFVSPETAANNRFFAPFFRLAGNDQRTFVVWGALAVILVFVLKNFIGYLSTSLQSRFAADTAVEVSEKLFMRYVLAPFSFHLDRSCGELTARINRITIFVMQVVQPLMLVMSESIVFLFLAAAIFIVSPAAAAIMCLTAGIMLIVFYFPVRTKIRNANETACRKDVEIMKMLLQSFSASREVKLSRAEEYFTRITTGIQRERFQSGRKSYTLSQIPRFAIETSAVILASVLMIVLTLGSETPSDSLAMVVFFAAAMFRLLPSCTRIHYNLLLIKGNAYLFDQLCSDLTDEGCPGEKPGDGGEISFRDAIKVENVSFAYPGGREEVFRDFSLEIKKNECVAITGATGCGKSTLADLIMGFLTPQKGRITVDGKDVASSPASWRKLVKCVPQTTVLFDDTVRANVAFGVPREQVDDEKVFRALELAQMRSVVDGLPGKLDFTLGENGSAFSGGQKQRIAIARALYGEPELLVMDEATSALDDGTEEALADALDTLKGKMTIIIVAHRQNSIRRCGRVIAIDKSIQQA